MVSFVTPFPLSGLEIGQGCWHSPLGPLLHMPVPVHDWFVSSLTHWSGWCCHHTLKTETTLSNARNVPQVQLAILRAMIDALGRVDARCLHRIEWYIQLLRNSHIAQYNKVQLSLNVYKLLHLSPMLGNICTTCCWCTLIRSERTKILLPAVRFQFFIVQWQPLLTDYILLSNILRS